MATATDTIEMAVTGKPDAKGYFYRDGDISLAAEANKSRIVSMAFSSEKPVLRYDDVKNELYYEVLDHGPGNYDFSRLNSGGAFLVNHNPNVFAGGVVRGSAVVGEDRVGRCDVKISRSTLGNEILADMEDGIRPSVSFGYQLTRLVSKEKMGGLELRRYVFRACEVSTVPIPADESVGIGRSEIEPTKQNQTNPISIITKNMKDETIPTPPVPPAPTPGLSVNQPEDSRAREIRAIANRIADRVPSITGQAEDAIVFGTSLEDFRSKAIAQLPKVEPLPTAKPLDVKPKEWARYSLARAITAKLAGKLDGFEKEISDEISLKNGRQADGFWLPDEVMARNAIAGTGTLGGMLVQTDNLATQFIEVLRNKSQVLNLGARVLNLSRQATIPRQSAAHTANWAGETVASTLSGVQLQQLTLTPQAITSYVQYSKMLLLENDPSIDGILRDDITAQLAIAIDLAALHGTGSGQPTGIIATTGIGSVLLATNGLAIGNTTAYPAMVSLESVVAAANADSGALAYLMRPSIRGVLRTTTRFASTNTPVFENDTVNGYKALCSNQISAALTTGTATTITTPVFYGNWNDLIVANFGSTDIVVDEYTAAVNRVVRIYAHRFCDIGVRHPASFCVLGGILNG